MFKTLVKFGLLALGVLLFVLVVRALLYTSRQVEVAPVTISLDAKSAAQRLARSVQLRTISFEDPKEFKGQPFLDFHKFLETSYPRVHKHLKREVVNKYSLLYTWKGSDPSRKPFLLMGHIDVVPIAPGTRKRWKHPPFAGTIADGKIWGRGTLDDKCAILAILEAVEALLAQNKQPKRTLYLAFGHDEEIGGTQGAQKIAALLKSRGVKLSYVLDEGMVITRQIIPGVTPPVALIGLAEKGFVTIKLSVDSAGGHSSMPPKQTAIGILSSAIHRLERNPMPASLDNPTGKMFASIGPEMGFGKKIIFANLWLFQPLLLRILSGKPSTNASIRTTTAATIFRAGVKDNVLPAKASALVNFRILPGDTTRSVVQHVRRVLQDKRIKVRVHNPNFAKNPSPVSSTQTRGYQSIQRTIREVFPKALVAPSLMLGGTDSRHYLPLSANIYRFLPISVASRDLKRIHGTNERITVANYANIVRFMRRLIQNSQK